MTKSLRGPYLSSYRPTREGPSGWAVRRPASAFEQALYEADRLLAVGYSFRDAHINTVIQRWLVTDPARGIVVIDPNFNTGSGLYTEEFAPSSSSNSAATSTQRKVGSCGAYSSISASLRWPSRAAFVILGGPDTASRGTRLIPAPAYQGASCSWLAPGIGCAQPDSPYVVRAVAPNAHADADQGPAITLQNHLDHRTLLQPIDHLPDHLVADTSAEGDEQDEREQRCSAVGNRVQRSASIHG